MMGKHLKVRCLIAVWRATMFRVIVRAIRKYYPETVSYDPDMRIYVFQWTKELDDHLCGERGGRSNE